MINTHTTVTRYADTHVHPPLLQIHSGYTRGYTGPGTGTGTGTGAGTGVGYGTRGGGYLTFAGSKGCMGHIISDEDSEDSDAERDGDEAEGGALSEAQMLRLMT